MRIILPVSFLIGTQLTAQPQVNGPMPGHIDLLEATIWMQCHGPCTAYLEYWPIDLPHQVERTVVQSSEARMAHAMDFVLDHVVPGTTYSYRPVVNDSVVDVGEPLRFTTQALWKYRTDPPPFTMAIGSCAYVNEPAYDRPGTPYGGELRIFDAIAAQDPDLMLWLGDNIYLREPDWGSRTGFLHRYTHTRSVPELQHLLRSTAHVAICDDHDMGPNDSDGSFINAPLAREMFDLFWPNPTHGAPGVEGLTTALSHLDVDLFLMDDRTFRTRSDMVNGTRQILGPAQLDWLIRALKYSDASFKLIAIGGQVLNTAAVFENMANYPEERTELLRRIEEEGIKNVVFLSGDRHFTELSRMPLSDGRMIHDLTVSPLTAGVHPPKETNSLRVEGTVIAQHNFGTLSFSGPKGKRRMLMKIHDKEGAVLWEQSVLQQ